jgi:hypothetical protein
MYLLGIDVGTGGTRALIIDEKGYVVASATEEHKAFASPRIGWAEQEPEDWWRACGMAVVKALGSANLSGDRIGCVGFSGQMHGAVMLDGRDAVVRPALIWCDVRTGKQCLELTQKIGSERLIRLTCNPALPNFTLTKFLWVRENEPENWKRVLAAAADPRPSLEDNGEIRKAVSQFFLGCLCSQPTQQGDDAFKNTQTSRTLEPHEIRHGLPAAQLRLPGAAGGPVPRVSRTSPDKESI